MKLTDEHEEIKQYRDAGYLKYGDLITAAETRALQDA